MTALAVLLYGALVGLAALFGVIVDDVPGFIAAVCVLAAGTWVAVSLAERDDYDD